jgi:UDP-N-acetylglucosamine 2-epimerase (non-hydrolysing)
MILLSYGTRPEWIKLKPVLEKLKVPHKVVFTGQHEDISVGTYDERLIFPDCENRLDSAFAAVAQSEGIFDDVKYVLVQGDTASALAVAMAAYHRKIKIVHLEAGLRSYNFEHPYPEEFYRKTITSIAYAHVCPTLYNAKNIEKERGRAGDEEMQIFVTGNTVCDNLTSLKPEYGDEVLVTLHRRENHDSLGEWFTALDVIAEANPDITFTLPLHPNPNVQKHKDALKSVNVVEPIPYDEFIERLSKCKFVISDSGGIQEESAFLRKKCIVCRKYTERTEGLGVFGRLCATPDALPFMFESVNRDYEVGEVACPYGDGDSSSRVAQVLEMLNEDF